MASPLGLSTRSGSHGPRWRWPFSPITVCRLPLRSNTTIACRPRVPTAIRSAFTAIDMTSGSGSSRFSGVTSMPPSPDVCTDSSDRRSSTTPYSLPSTSAPKAGLS